LICGTHNVEGNALSHLAARNLKTEQILDDRVHDVEFVLLREVRRDHCQHGPVIGSIGFRYPASNSRPRPRMPYLLAPAIVACDLRGHELVEVKIFPPITVERPRIDDLP
jgi:hypothetical protein